MIIWRSEAEDIFKSPMKTIVIPVNCQGTMGKGLALQCAKRHPTVRTRYRYLCEHKMFEPGSVHVCYVSEQREIALAATKDSWRKPSRVEWVERILDGFGGVTAIIWGGGV